MFVLEFQTAKVSILAEGRVSDLIVTLGEHVPPEDELEDEVDVLPEELEEELDELLELEEEDPEEELDDDVLGTQVGVPLSSS